MAEPTQYRCYACGLTQDEPDSKCSECSAVKLTPEMEIEAERDLLRFEVVDLKKKVTAAELKAEAAVLRGEQAIARAQGIVTHWEGDGMPETYKIRWWIFSLTVKVHAV